MAKTRVHDLAKEFGMSSKEMLDHLSEMKIPAKSASSTNFSNIFSKSKSYS